MVEQYILYYFLFIIIQLDRIKRLTFQQPLLLMCMKEVKLLIKMFSSFILQIIINLIIVFVLNNFKNVFEFNRKHKKLLY